MQRLQSQRGVMATRGVLVGRAATRSAPSRGRSLLSRHPTKRGSILPASSGLFGSDSDSSSSSSGSPGDWHVPTVLLPTGTGQLAPPADGADNAAASTRPMTVYTLRLTTSWDRGSALSEPHAGVNVCLVGRGGAGVLHRIAPVNDPQEQAEAMSRICSLVGDDVGADCSVLDSADGGSSPPPSWAPPPGRAPPPPKRRFQEGAVDEVSFVAPDLGPLAAVLLAPEAGSWACDEVDVSSSRTRHLDRFVCRRKLGGGSRSSSRGGGSSSSEVDLLAAHLTPVPPDAVLYGSGAGARVLAREQAAGVRDAALRDYEALKARLLLTTALLTIGGSGAAALASGPDAAVPFALGGLAGILYQSLLALGAEAAVFAAAGGAGGGATAAAVSGAGGSVAGSGGAGVLPPPGGDSVSAAASAFSAAAARSGGGLPPGALDAAPFVAGQDDGGDAWPPGGLRDRAMRVAGSAAFRLLLLAAAAFAAASALSPDPVALLAGGSSPAAPAAAPLLPAGAAEGGAAAAVAAAAIASSSPAFLQLGCGVAGFMMYKVALLSAAIAPNAPGGGGSGAGGSNGGSSEPPPPRPEEEAAQRLRKKGA